jgi:hypothetical protein
MIGMIMTLIERIKYYDNNYQILFSNLYISNKTFLGPVTVTNCRYCGKPYEKIFFKEIAHSIPESLGNKFVISKDECDECNRFFSNNIEVHFDKISKPWRNIGQIRGKKNKIPSYKTKDKKSRIDVKKTFEIREMIDSEFVEIDENKKTIKLTYDIEPYVPCAAYKALVKMALSIMPIHELENFKDAIHWILCSDHTRYIMKPLNVFFTFIPGYKPNKESIFILLKAKQNDPELTKYIFVLSFGNVIFQIIIPNNVDKEKTAHKKIVFFPNPFELVSREKYGSISYNILDWTSNIEVRDKILPLTMQFETMEEMEL